VGIGADIAICPSNVPSCVYTAPYEAAAFVFVGSLIALAVSGVGYAISWKRRLDATIPSPSAISTPITFECPHCGALINTRSNEATAKCQYCGETSKVPPSTVQTPTENPLGSSESKTTNFGPRNRMLPHNRCPLCGFGFNKPGATECKQCHYRFEYSTMTASSGGPGFRGFASGEPIFKVSARGNAFGWLALGGIFLSLFVVTSYPSFDSSYFVIGLFIGGLFVVSGLWILATAPKMEFYYSLVRVLSKSLARDILYPDVVGVSAEYTRAGIPNRIRFIVKGDKKSYKVPSGAFRAIPHEKGTKISLYSWLQEKTKSTTIE